jgi:hypothetical protein
MQRAMGESDRTIAVLSPAYLAAKFTQIEWSAAYAKDPTGEQGKLLPVRIADFEPPAIFSAVVYIDLVGLTEDTARGALLKGISRERSKPLTRPAFPTVANAAPLLPAALGAAGAVGPGEPAARAGVQASPFHPLVAGIEAASYLYATRVHNFLRQYVGALDRPVPFGGREKELSALSSWLDDPHERPYLLLSGRAGCGKSALLASWVQELDLRGSLDIAYFPVSMRFETNTEPVVFSSLAARLAHLSGKPLDAGTEGSPGAWREDFMRRLWQTGRQGLYC